MKTHLLLIFVSITFGLKAQTLSSSAPLSYSGKSNVIIENKIFTSGSNGASINLANCTGIIIRNCVFKNIPTNVGIQLSYCNNITIQGCLFDSTYSGVYAIKCTGGLVIQCNSFKDIVGPKPRGQMIQFNVCSGAGNRILNNILEQTPGAGTAEDLINMYASSGTAADPILISGNQTKGGSTTSSGGGLMLGDNGSSYITADNNILVDPGQYGIAASSGHHITISNNTVYARSQFFTNVGIYAGVASEVNAGWACDGKTISITGNKINWKNKNNVQNDIYICPCCPGVIQSGNTTRANISASILPTVLKLNSTCSSLNLNCKVLGTACPSTVTEIENEENTANDAFNLQVQNQTLAATSNELVNWKLLDVNGKIYYEQENQEAIKVDMSTFQNGMYLLMTISRSGKKTHKFIHSNN
jgi:hypothetical protein